MSAQQIKKCQTPHLPYLQWHKDAERRMAEGQEQVFCQTCKRFRWPDLLCELSVVTLDIAQENGYNENA
jgi:hypothetical protein